MVDREEQVGHEIQADNHPAPGSAEQESTVKSCPDNNP
jgi:hypothetical protein